MALAGDNTGVTISTLGQTHLKVGDTATIYYAVSCGLSAGSNFGTLHLFTVENSSVDLVPPITIPDLSGSSYQFSGSVTYTFTEIETVTVDARITGSTGAAGSTGMTCDRPTVSDGLTLNFTISGTEPSTTQSTVGQVAQTGSDTIPLVATGLVVLLCGAILVSHDRQVRSRRLD